MLLWVVPPVQDWVNVLAAAAAAANCRATQRINWPSASHVEINKSNTDTDTDTWGVFIELNLWAAPGAVTAKCMLLAEPSFDHSCVFVTSHQPRHVSHQ
jgi:hypothetical protein